VKRLVIFHVTVKWCTELFESQPAILQCPICTIIKKKRYFQEEEEEEEEEEERL
jgi:hypothetical protein